VSAKVTIITPTYNKPTYFAECTASVLAQTYQDWVWWVVFNRLEWDDDYNMRDRFWNDRRIIPIWYPNVYERAKVHITPRIVNWLYPKVQTPYIYFLADDDLIDRDGLGLLVPEMNQKWDSSGGRWSRDAVYGRCEVQDEQPDGTFKTGCWCYEGQDVGLNTSIDPDCRLDSSQILHTKIPLGQSNRRRLATQ
jgi:glycosyltransferase involved in cell wall biosynthesis